VTIGSQVAISYLQISRHSPFDKGFAQSLTLFHWDKHPIGGALHGEEAERLSAEHSASELDTIEFDSSHGRGCLRFEDPQSSVCVAYQSKSGLLLHRSRVIEYGTEVVVIQPSEVMGLSSVRTREDQDDRDILIHELDDHLVQVNVKRLDHWIVVSKGVHVSLFTREVSVLLFYNTKIPVYKSLYVSEMSGRLRKG
jgi:hypothetical protein